MPVNNRGGNVASRGGSSKSATASRSKQSKTRASLGRRVVAEHQDVRASDESLTNQRGNDEAEDEEDIYCEGDDNHGFVRDCNSDTGYDEDDDDKLDDKLDNDNDDEMGEIGEDRSLLDEERQACEKRKASDIDRGGGSSVATKKTKGSIFDNKEVKKVVREALRRKMFPEVKFVEQLDIEDWARDIAENDLQIKSKRLEEAVPNVMHLLKTQTSVVRCAIVRSIKKKVEGEYKCMTCMFV